MPEAETVDEATETDQYDTILRAMEPGLLFAINNSISNSLDDLPSGELRVIHSRDDKTDVTARGHGDTHYRVYRDRRGELVYGEVDEDGVSRESEVISLEILGIDS